MQDELEDKQEDYCSLDHDDWCDIMSTIKVKDNRKRAATQINRIATSKAAYYSDSDESIRVPRKKKANTGVINNHKQEGKKTPKYHSTQRYCVLCKKAGMPEQKHMSHSSENCFGKRSNQQSIKNGLGNPQVIGPVL